MSTTLVPRRNGLPGLFGDFEQEMSGLMDRFFNWENGPEPRGWFGMPANVAETDCEYEVTVDLPGIQPDDVDVELRHGDLWISGERKHESEEGDKRYHRFERHYGQFRRVLRLGDDVDPDNVDAQYRDGVLRIMIPKVESARSKHIPVKC